MLYIVCLRRVVMMAMRWFWWWQNGGGDVPLLFTAGPVGARCHGTPYVVNLKAGGVIVSEKRSNLTYSWASAKIQRVMGHQAQGEPISDECHTRPTTPGSGPTQRWPP